MNLATRCTACGTIFRVVQDQLKVSEGWVRCGRCQAVFNAQQGLFDLDREAPPPWQPAAVLPEPAEPTAVAAEAADSGEVEAATPPPDADVYTPSRAAPPPDPEGPPAVRETAVAHREFADELPPPSGPTERADVGTDDRTDERARLADAAAIDSAASDSARAEAAPSQADGIGVEATPAAPDETTADATPDFVRQAQRDERRDSRPVRAALALLAVLAALGLALQLAGHFRHGVAAQWPQATPWLQHYCEVFQCRAGATQRIDDVRIESTALTQDDPSPQADGASNALRLTVTLRNRGQLPVDMPSVDLSLTGADGELVSRRSLSPTDFQVSDPQLAPGIDAPLSVNFSVPGSRVSGYTVEVFYP